jgi:hypothetical protein
VLYSNNKCSFISRFNSSFCTGRFSSIYKVEGNMQMVSFVAKIVSDLCHENLGLIIAPLQDASQESQRERLYTITHLLPLIQPKNLELRVKRPGADGNLA